MGSDRPKRHHKSAGLRRPVFHARRQKSHAKARKGKFPGMQKMITAFFTQKLPAVAAIRATVPAEMNAPVEAQTVRYMNTLSRALEGDSGAGVGERGGFHAGDAVSGGTLPDLHARGPNTANTTYILVCTPKEFMRRHRYEYTVRDTWHRGRGSTTSSSRY